MSDIKALAYLPAVGSVLTKDSVIMPGPLSSMISLHIYIHGACHRTPEIFSGSVECGNGRRINCYLSKKCGKVPQDLVSESDLKMLLVMDKLLYEIGEVGLSNFGGNGIRVNSAYCTCSLVYFSNTESYSTHMMVFARST